MSGLKIVVKLVFRFHSGVFMWANLLFVHFTKRDLCEQSQWDSSADEGCETVVKVVMHSDLWIMKVGMHVVIQVVNSLPGGLVVKMLVVVKVVKVVMHLEIVLWVVTIQVVILSLARPFGLEVVHVVVSFGLEVVVKVVIVVLKICVMCVIQRFMMLFPNVVIWS